MDCAQRFINEYHLDGRPILKQLLAKGDLSSLRQHSSPATVRYTHSCIPNRFAASRGGKVLYSPIAHDACREDRRTRKTKTKRGARLAIPE